MAPPGARRAPPPPPRGPGGAGAGPGSSSSGSAAAPGGGPPPPAFVSHDATLARPTSIAHWQLRDLLACPSAEGELYLVRHCATLRYDVDTGKVREGGSAAERKKTKEEGSVEACARLSLGLPWPSLENDVPGACSPQAHPGRAGLSSTACCSCMRGVACKRDRAARAGARGAIGNCAAATHARENEKPWTRARRWRGVLCGRHPSSQR